MTKRTKRALVSSALALLLCFTMLLGTTYAWFTDSVTTVNNKIVAGNLDIELYSAFQPEDGVLDDADWNMVDANTNIFETGTLWEPGHVEVAYLWAKNVGTLALEWDLAINIVNEVTSTSVLGNDLVLSSYLKAQLVEIDATAPEAYADRAAAKAAVTAGYGLTSYTGEGVLKAGETKAYALIVYMPEEVGNEANYAKGAAVPSIDMGITLFATQTPYENDSFGNDYDELAPYVEVATFDELQNALNTVGYAKLTADIDATQLTPANVSFQIPEGKKAVIDLNGFTLTNKDGGTRNNAAIYINRGADLTIEDSSAAGTGKIVASCYGIYVQPNAKLTMNGGTLDVSGNGVYDYAVVVWNGNFVMNAGTINANCGVVPSNYWKNNGEDAMINMVTINDGCVINALTMDFDLKDALDTILVDNR